MSSEVAKEIGRGALRTLIYYVLILAVLMYWQGSGLFIYEGF